MPDGMTICSRGTVEETEKDKDQDVEEEEERSSSGVQVK